MDERPRTEKKIRPSIWETLFLRYGAGARAFLPVTRSRAWPAISWTLIGIGAVVWIAAWIWSTYQ